MNQTLSLFESNRKLKLYPIGYFLLGSTKHFHKNNNTIDLLHPQFHT